MIVSRLRMIFTDAEMERIRVEELENGELQITTDVHGLSCKEVRKFISNIISLVKKAFELIVIHGYLHGIAIKEMLVQHFENDHISEKYGDLFNYGVTHMVIVP